LTLCPFSCLGNKCLLCQAEMCYSAKQYDNTQLVSFPMYN